MTEVQNGRRPRRAVLVAAATGLLVPLVAVAVASGLFDAKTSATAQADNPTGCQTVPLPVPAGTTSTVNGGDPTGRHLVGHVTYPDGRRVGALWTDGQYTEIDASSLKGVQVDYHDVNSDGVVVGERMTDHSSFHTDAFTYRDGKFTVLPAPRPGESTQALGINARGDVVGNSTENGWTTIVWPAKGSPRALPVPPASIGGGMAAVQGGMAAGNVYDPATNRTVPALWNLATGSLTMHRNVPAGAVSVNSKGTIGVGGALVYADGRVVSVGDGAMVNTVADTGVAAGATAGADGQAVLWVGC